MKGNRQEHTSQGVWSQAREIPAKVQSGAGLSKPPPEGTGGRRMARHDQVKSRRLFKRRARRAGWTAAVLAAAVPAGMLLVPTRTNDLVSSPRPARTYREALERLEALRAHDGPEVNSVCATEAL